MLARARAAILIAAVATPALAAPAHAPRPFAPGTQRVKTDERVTGFRRSYLVHVPPGHDGLTPLPVVLALHGAFSTARAFERVSGLSRLADRERFLVVYPQGIGLFNLFRHWNSGHCCAKARALGLDDVGFALGAVDDVARRFPVDRSRLYVLGHSNGGMLAYRIAAERPGIVAAVATVAATIGGNPSANEPEWILPRPARPVPALTVHGRDDESVPYDGGPAVGRRDAITAVSVERSIALWIDAGACDARPQVETTHDGHVERKAWPGCDDGAEVVLYSLKGWGHDWPGGPFTAQLPAQDPLRAFEAVEIIWPFFQRHRRTP
jgi:polyhydroxybutyrate depolymerase